MDNINKSLDEIIGIASTLYIQADAFEILGMETAKNNNTRMAVRLEKVREEIQKSVRSMIYAEVNAAEQANRNMMNAVFATINGSK